MPDLPLVYWDACVFLSYINGDANRLPDIDALLNKSGTEFWIITSVLSIVEVAFGKTEQDGKALDEATERRISDLWEPPSPIKVSEFYSLIAQEARALMRQALLKQWALRPPDAIHLATARRVGATKFETYDDKLYKFTDLVGMPIGAPIAPAPELPFPISGAAMSDAGYSTLYDAHAYPAMEE